MYVAGKQDVIDLLETYLSLAKSGNYGSAAVVLTSHPGEAAADFRGDNSLQPWTLNMLGVLHNKLLETVENNKRPEQDAGADFDCVCYNMTSAPLGFDFLIWLIDAEMTRIREGAPPPLKVGFWCGLDPTRLSARARGWLNNVYRPLLPLVGAVEDDRGLVGHCKEMYMPRDIVAACRNGEVVPRLRAVTPVPYHGAVTITLREVDYAPSRNSNLVAWQQFAFWLDRDVVFIRDTAKANEPLSGCRTDPRASVDLQYRFALYEGADINLFVGNGPSGVAMFGSRPFMIFLNPPKDNNPEYWNRPQQFGHAHGIAHGGQYPWFDADQRIVWSADNFENLKDAWTKFAPRQAVARYA